jgi:hypothetical protein
MWFVIDPSGQNLDSASMKTELFVESWQGDTGLEISFKACGYIET